MNTYIIQLHMLADNVREYCITLHDINGHTSIADDIDRCAKGLQRDIDTLTGALQQSDHFIVFSEDGWSIEHLVTCRPNMTECEYHKAAQQVYGRLGLPLTEGRYKMTLIDDIPEWMPRIGLDKVEES